MNVHCCLTSWLKSHCSVYPAIKKNIKRSHYKPRKRTVSLHCRPFKNTHKVNAQRDRNTHSTTCWFGKTSKNWNKSTQNTCLYSMSKVSPTLRHMFKLYTYTHTSVSCTSKKDKLTHSQHHTLHSSLQLLLTEITDWENLQKHPEYVNKTNKNMTQKWIKHLNF